jgi:hypothetical protein
MDLRRLAEGGFFERGGLFGGLGLGVRYNQAASGRKPLVPRCDVRRVDAEHGGDLVRRHMGAFVLDDQLDLRGCGVEGHLVVYSVVDLIMGAAAWQGSAWLPSQGGGTGNAWRGKVGTARGQDVEKIAALNRYLYPKTPS